jgi:hypothetical protein
MRMRSYWKCAAAKAGLAAAFAAFLACPAIAGAATITVDSAADDGTGCTLREAILAADTNMDQTGCTRVGGSTDDTISFANGLGTITLNGTELQIATFSSPGALLIQGPGASQLTVHGNDLSRVFSVLSNADASNAVSINGLTIAHGRILLTAAGPQIAGAGVRNAGTLTLDHDRLTANSLTATDTAPGPQFALATGAGAFNAGTLTVHDTLVDGNSATTVATGGSGAFNTADSRGAGIGSLSASLTVSFSTVSGNTTTAAASGASSGNFGVAEGIGIWSAFGGSLDVDHSLIKANSGSTSASGAGASTTAKGGGILKDATGAIVESTIVGNVPNATLTQGGGVFTAQTTSLVSDTLTGNAAFGPGSNGANLHQDVGTVTVQNTILAQPPAGKLNCAGTITSSGHNLSDDGSCSLVGAGDLPNDANVNLLALDDYGGPTETRPPSAFGPGGPSHAIDAGVLAGQTNDQRGFQRKWQFSVADGAGDGTDIGAAELQGPTLLGTSPASPGSDAQPEVFGFAEETSDVKLYTTSDCTGSTHGQGFTADFASPGLTVTPPLGSNTSTTFYATSTIGTLVSECSAPFSSATYLRNPVIPVLTSTTPSSGSNDNSPKILGTADSTATVNLYTSPTCTGPIAGTGSGADLAGSGIAATVPDNSTTTLYARAFGIPGTAPSACSTGLSYSEVTPAPIPAPTPAPKKKKCKKAKKGSAQLAKKCKRRK